MCFPKCWSLELHCSLCPFGDCSTDIKVTVFWGMILHRWVDRNIWEERTAFIFWVEELAVRGTNGIDTGRHEHEQKLWEPAGPVVPPSLKKSISHGVDFLPYIIIFYYQTTILPWRWRQQITSNMLYLSIDLVSYPEDCNVNIHWCANLKSYAFHWYLYPDNDVNSVEWIVTSHHHHLKGYESPPMQDVQNSFL
jgi:hypothetical protein